MTDNDQNRILNRIKKMLNLANDAGATEGERDNALRMAYATMQKHNLDLATIEGHDITGKKAPDEQRERFEATFISHHWARVASMAIAELFFCSYFYSRSKRTGKVEHNFVGRTSNAITAREISIFICRSIDRESRAFGSAHRDFCKGAVTKIVRRCYDMRHEAEAPVATSPGMSLVLVNFYDSEKAANQQLIANIGIKTHTKKTGDRDAKDSGAYYSGQAFGSKVSLNRQVTK